MKKRFGYLIFAAVLLLAACGRGADNGGGELLPDVTQDDTYEDLLEDDNDIDDELVIIEHVEYMEDIEDEITHESAIPLDVAAAYFAAAQAFWDEDDGRLWGVPLHVPLMISCRVTRHAVTNMPDPYGFFTPQGDVYVGVLPDFAIIGYTAIRFSGLWWGTITWQSIDNENIPREWIMYLLVHEGFHAIQEEIIPGAFSYTRHFQGGMPHMNTALARISVSLELNALAAAITSRGEARLAAIHDALSIRADRRQTFPAASFGENAGEIIEGLATFTDSVLMFGVDEAIHRLNDRVLRDEVPHNQFYYRTGAMYALLLQETDADWQYGITPQTDLGYLLQNALGITPSPIDQIDLEQWGYSQISQAQNEYAANRQRRIAEAYDAMRHYVTIRGDFYHSSGEGGFVVTHAPSQRLIWHGYHTLISTNVRIYVQGGHFGTGIMPNRVMIGGVEDIVVDEDHSRAVAPTWTLEIIDDDYRIDVLEDGGIRVIRR